MNNVPSNKNCGYTHGFIMCVCACRRLLIESTCESRGNQKCVCLRFAQSVRGFVGFVLVRLLGLLPSLALMTRIIAQSVKARNGCHLGIPPYEWGLASTTAAAAAAASVGLLCDLY